MIFRTGSKSQKQSRNEVHISTNHWNNLKESCARLKFGHVNNRLGSYSKRDPLVNLDKN